MQVRVNANHTVPTQESLERWATQELTQALQRFAHDITSLEVHFSDENGERLGATQSRCVIEARLSGHTPIAASANGERLDEALRGATDKLKHALDHALAKSRPRSRDSIRRDGAAIALQQVNPDVDPRQP